MIRGFIGWPPRLCKVFINALVYEFGDLITHNVPCLLFWLILYSLYSAPPTQPSCCQRWHVMSKSACTGPMLPNAAIGQREGNEGEKELELLRGEATSPPLILLFLASPPPPFPLLALAPLQAHAYAHTSPFPIRRSLCVVVVAFPVGSFCSSRFFLSFEAVL